MSVTKLCINFPGLFGLFAPTGLNVSSPQNVSLEGETWTERSPDHLQHPPAREEEQLYWEKEPGTQIIVTIKEEVEADFVYGETFGQGVHKILKEGEEQHGESSEKQGQDQKVENKTRTEQIQEKNQGGDQSISPSVDTPLSTSLPSQYFLSTITTRSSADITKTNSDIEGQNISHSSHFSDLRKISMPSTNETSTDENSSLGQIEGPEEYPTLTVMAARAGPTAMSLPSTIKQKGSTKIPKIKDKLKKKGKKAKDKSGKPMKNAKQVIKFKQDQNELTTTPYFPYFEDHYCPPDCACYGRYVLNMALLMLSLGSVQFINFLSYVCYLVLTGWCNVQTKGWIRFPTEFLTIPATFSL